MQLFVSQSQLADARKLVGQTIAATRALNEWITAAQYTKVWMRVETLERKL
jgi:hypothetical protein